MGRRRKPNKKGGESDALTPPPADVDSDNGAADPADTDSPTAAAAEQSPAPTPHIKVAEEPEESRAAAETPPAAPHTTALAASTPVAEADTAVETQEPETVVETQEPVTTVTPQEPPTTPAAAATPTEGVEALNAYALQTASAASSDEKSASSFVGEVKNESQAATETPSGDPATPRRASTKKVAFITPVVSSITSASDTDMPRESNCIEARCGSCSVM